MTRPFYSLGTPEGLVLCSNQHFGFLHARPSLEHLCLFHHKQQVQAGSFCKELRDSHSLQMQLVFGLIVWEGVIELQSECEIL